MRSKQDGTGMAPYAAETRREVRTLGRGGRGNAESLKDSIRRGVTPDLAAEAAERSAPRPRTRTKPAVKRLPPPAGPG